MRGNKYKIIVADKETKYVSVIGRLAESNDWKVKIVNHVNSGVEAIRQTKERNPDILIIDIKLDDISGIDVIKEIRRFNQTIHIIILTQYDCYEFMKEAIPLGLEAYLLKPVQKEIISKEMEKVLALLEKETEKNILEAEREVSKQECLRFTEYSYIYSILFNIEYAIDIPHYQKELDSREEGYIMNVEIKPRNKDKKIELAGYSNKLYQCIKETISKSSVCVVGPRIINRIIVFVCEENKKTKEQKKEILNLCEEVIENVSITLGIKVEIGVGSIKSSQQIHVSYEEALKALRCRKEVGDKSAHIYDNNSKWGEINKSYTEVERIMLSNVKRGEEQTFENFSTLLNMMKGLDLDIRKNKVIEILVLCSHEGRKEGSDENPYVDYITYLEELKDVSEEDIERWALQKLHYTLKTIRIQKSTQLPFAISTAVAYIEKHYTDNIQLDDVASQVGFTPQYFSTYFKEEMKCSFLDYLTELRMEKARELISKAEVSVQEICFLVGYHNPNYFSRIFKKCNGCTPSVYKSRVENRVEKQKENFTNL